MRRLGPLRVLIVASEGPPTRSGIARTVEQLVLGLRSVGHHVDIVAYPQVPRLVAGEIRLSALLLHLPRLAALVGRYELINLHGIAPTCSDVFLLFARLRRERCPPLVYTHHCNIAVGPLALLNCLYKGLHRRLAGAADEVVATSQAYATALDSTGRVSIIPLGVDPSRFRWDAAKDARFTVLFVGQFRPYKGVLVLLHAAAQVYGVRLLIAGHGPEERAYRALAARLGVDAEFHIAVDDEHLAALYRRAHVIALPSVTPAEAFGLTLLEGMAAGCLPVASDLPGVREVLGRIGWTVPPGSVRALAATLRHLRDSPALLEEIGARAQQRAAAFTWQRTVSAYERLFASIVAVRELGRRLAGSIAWPRALDAFLATAACILQAERVDLLLQSFDGRLASVVARREVRSTRGQRADDHIPRASMNHHGDRCASGQPFDGIPAALARYTCEARESVVYGASRTPRALRERLDGWPASAIAAPLVSRGRVFGALVAVRVQPFDERDLASLERLARHAAPALYACCPPTVYWGAGSGHDVNGWVAEGGLEGSGLAWRG